MQATTQTARPNVISEKIAWIGQSAGEYHTVQHGMIMLQRLAERRSFKRSEKRGQTMPKLTIAERFARKVSVMPSGCHEWQGCITRNGYGQINRNRRAEYSHRIAYELAYGNIPSGKFVLHSCDNRRCVNPSHLWIGTFDDNMEDMVSKGRQAAGTKNFHAKLKPEQVHAIRSAIGTQKEIAAEFNVTPSLISMFRSGRIWRSI